MSIIAEALKKAARKKESLAHVSEKTQPNVQPDGVARSEPTQEPIVGAMRSTEESRRIKPAMLIVALLVVGSLALSSNFVIRSRRPTDKTSVPHDPTQNPVATIKPNEVQAKVSPVRNSISNGVAPLSLLPRSGSNLVLNGIVGGHGEPIAIINNKVLWLGDSIEGHKVVQITQNKVTLSKDSSDIVLELK